MDYRDYKTTPPPGNASLSMGFQVQTHEGLPEDFFAMLSGHASPRYTISYLADVPRPPIWKLRKLLWWLLGVRTSRVTLHNCRLEKDDDGSFSFYPEGTDA